MFTRASRAGAATFHEGRAPSVSNVAAAVVRVVKRMQKWLRRRGLVDERAAEERSNEAPWSSPMVEGAPAPGVPTGERAFGRVRDPSTVPFRTATGVPAGRSSSPRTYSTSAYLASSSALRRGPIALEPE